MTAAEVLARLDGVKRTGGGWSAKCPAHQDRSPSLSITEGADGRILMRCHAGCETGDICRALGIRLADLFSTSPSNQATTTPVSMTRRSALHLPSLSEGSEADWKALANMRHLDVDAVRVAVGRGLIWFATVKGHDSWIITDRKRVNAQARRLDGGKWDHLNGAKAYTMPGSQAAWPVGVPEASDYCLVALVEGGPDLLAAFHFALREGQVEFTGPVAMLGASLSIPDAALPMFTECWVRVFPHSDDAGMKAGLRWARSLEKFATTVDIFDASGAGEGVSDLNDLALVAEPSLRILP